MRTPLIELISRLEALKETNPMDSNYQAGIADALTEAKLLLPIERSHLKAAWRDGGQSILNQTAEQYLRETYERQA